MLKKIDRFFSGLCGAFGVISVLCIVGVIVLITVDVVIRKFGGNVKGAYEITERLLMCSVFSGLAYTESKRGHICVTMLLGAFPRAVRFIIFALMQLASSAMSFYVAPNRDIAENQNLYHRASDTAVPLLCGRERVHGTVRNSTALGEREELYGRQKRRNGRGNTELLELKK